MNFSKLSLFSYVVILIFLPLGYLIAADGEKKLEFVDKIYENHIKTAILYHADDIKATPLYPAALPINQNIPLVLKFDELYTDEADYYQAKLIHCRLDWQPSDLAEMQYLYDYNEFNIDEFEFSVATKVPYTHFTFRVPPVKIPGNYLLVVYRENNEKDIIISKRFMVYDQKVEISAHVGLSTGVVQRRMNQQIEFAVDYSNFSIMNPYTDIHVVIRQNHRWDNAIYNLKPTMIKEDVSKLEYRHFDFTNNFKAGNEFRFFDIRSVNYGGQNVDNIKTTDTRIDAFLYFDKSRGTEPYTFINDLNGGFVIENSEGNNDFLESDYINVHFFLDLKEAIANDIYVIGKLTDWRYDEFNKMKFVEVSDIYACNLLLKQGLYDFIYYIPESQEDPILLEGSHNETQNEYEIIIYYNDLRLNADVIIGYVKLS